MEMKEKQLEERLAVLALLVVSLHCLLILGVVLR
jgi:hypothetical protein